MKKILLAFFMGVLLFPAVADAHKVIVFAWVEEGMIHTQSSFGSKRKAKDCAIALKDENGTIINQGVTDAQGLYSFSMPDNLSGDITVFLDAGNGHQASWRIPNDELVSGIATISEAKKQSVKEEREKIQASPSPLKIISGIGVIFFLALILRHVKKKKGPQ